MSVSWRLEPYKLRAYVAPSLEKIRILVVDDDPDAREVLQTALEQRRASVVSASSVDEALAIFERERPDVVLSDIAMPEEDGYDLVRRVRAHSTDEGGDTPVIAVTAYSAAADRARAFAAGFDRYVAKPVDLDHLVDAVLAVHQARLHTGT